MRKLIGASLLIFTFSFSFKLFVKENIEAVEQNARVKLKLFNEFNEFVDPNDYGNGQPINIRITLIIFPPKQS